MQLRPLLEDPSLMATTSRTARVRENLMFSYLGYPVPVRLNTSSLMFRVGPVRQELGYFDAVRKGADSEFLKRLQVVFGENSYKPLQSVLSLVRLGADSLSRSDFRAGWHHPAREAYRAAYTYWHEEIRRGTRNGRIDPEDQRRPFPAPAAFDIARTLNGSPRPRSYDVILVSDWRGDGGPQNSMIQEIAALKAQGYSVAICHLEALRFMTGRMELPSSRVQALINAGNVDQVTLLDDVETTLLLMRYPPILQFPPAFRSTIRARHAIMVANQAPHESDGSDQRYEVHDCIRNARNLFAIDPIWAPQGPLVRDMIEPLLPKALLSPLNLAGFVDPSDWRMTRPPLSGARPVIGRYSRDDAMKFPDSRETLLACYPDTGSCNVRIMGGLKSCQKLLGADGFPVNWTMLEHKEIPPRDFLEEIDFFVHFDNPNIVEAFGRSLLEAIASGRVTILPEKFRRVFGDAAVYCRPEEVERVVRSFWSSPGKYQKQSEIARSVVEEKFSEKAFQKNILALAPSLCNLSSRTKD
jgi:O-antigen biosynthesis protein